MYQQQIFHFKYPTGYMNINVRSFFGTASEKEIEKALRLIRRNCGDSRRLELISKLQIEQIRLKEVLHSVEDLECKRRKLLAPIFSNNELSWVDPAEKSVIQMRDRLNWMIELLSSAKEKKRWRG